MTTDFDPDREKLLHFLQVGGGGGQYRRRHHQLNNQPSRAGTTRRGKKKKKKKSFFCCVREWWWWCLKRLLGTRTTTTQKVLLFAPMVWFAVSVLSLARFKTSSEGERSDGVAKTSFTTGGASERGESHRYRPQNHNPHKMRRSKEDDGRVVKSSFAHEKAPIPILTFESDEKMRAEREREEATSAQNRHPCLNNGVYKVETDECVCHGGWKGENCDRAICEQVNCVHGRCVKPDVCECFPGFSTFDCSKDFIRDESGMLLDHLQVRLHTTSIGLSKKDPAEAIELVQRWGSSGSGSSSSSSSRSKSENEVDGPWLAREDALGNRVLKTDQNPHNKLFLSCAVVGNSFHLEKVDGLAEVVDEHEAVIRLDAAPTTGRFASMVGTKTTVRVLSDAFLEEALKNPSKYAKLFTSANGASNSGSWETKGLLWEPNSVSKLRQARRAFPELDVQFASPEILYPAKTIFNEVYDRLNAETKEHIEKDLFGSGGNKGEDESNGGGRGGGGGGGVGYSFFSSSKSSPAATNKSELKPTLSNAFFAVFLSLQMCVNVNVYGIDPPHEFLHDDDHDETDSYFDTLSGGSGPGVSPASKTYESLLLRLFHDRRLTTSCDGFTHMQKCVSFTPRGRKGVIAHQVIHW